MQLSAKNHQQGHTEHKAGNGVADQNEQRGDQIKAGTCPHRLGHAQRHRDQVADEKSPQAEADGHRHFFLYQLPHVLVLEEAAPQVEARKLAQHLQKTLVRRLVEAIQLLDLFQALGVHALCAAVAQPAALCARTPCARLGLGQVLLHRSAGNELHHGEGKHQHTQKRGQHEQDAFEDVGEHGSVWARFGLRGAAAPGRPKQGQPPRGGSDLRSGGAWGLHFRAHQVSITQVSPGEYGGTTLGLAKRQAL